MSIGNLAAATACFARDASFLTPDATTIRGRDDIRAVLAQLVAMRSQIHIDMQSTLRAGEIALVTGRWTIRLPIKAAPFAQSASACFVVHRIEGSWKAVIAAPWGWRGQR